jgi:AcrR family transcriptional regulator
MSESDAPLAPRKRPTQARARQTVEAILQAAAEVFEAHGLEGGTTERIVERAGVSVGSLYQYFPNKRSLLAAVAESALAESRVLQARYLASLVADPPPDVALRGLIAFLVAVHDSQPRLRCLIFEDSDMREALKDDVNAFNGELRVGLTRYMDRQGQPDPDVKALVLHTTVGKLVHQFVLHPVPELSSARAAEEVFRMAIGYIAA